MTDLKTQYLPNEGIKILKKKDNTHTHTHISKASGITGSNGQVPDRISGFKNKPSSLTAWFTNVYLICMNNEVS